MRRGRAGVGGFTLVELLVVIAIISIISIVAVPALMKAQTKATRKEAMTNIMNVAGLLDKFYADGNFTYNWGDGVAGNCTASSSVTRTFCNTGCDGATCTGGPGLDPNNDAVDDLVLQGDKYSYAVTATDGADADALCEAYSITATGCDGTLVDNETLTLTSTGAKSGMWQ